VIDVGGTLTENVTGAVNETYRSGLITNTTAIDLRKIASTSAATWTNPDTEPLWTDPDAVPADPDIADA
jgi:hypothetical protein